MLMKLSTNIIYNKSPTQLYVCPTMNMNTKVNF
jgi:hypothetical protein